MAPCTNCVCPFLLPESLAEAFGLKTSTQPVVTDASSLISFSLSAAPSSSGCGTAAVMEAPSQAAHSSSTPASVSAAAADGSTQQQQQPQLQLQLQPQPPFMHVSAPQQAPDVPAQASGQAPGQVAPHHYVALPPAFQHTDSSAPLQPPIPAPAPAAAAAAPSLPAATSLETDALAAAAQPVPLASNPAPNSGPSLQTAPATITIAPTQNLLQPGGLVMSDQNLQWILSSAAHSQQNPEQPVSGAPTRCLQLRRGDFVLLG